VRKYLAILKDSLREVIDSKIFLVMLVFSLLVILFLASITYVPTTAKDEVERFGFRLNFRLRFLLRTDTMLPLPQRVEVVDFQQTNDATEPWDGDFRFNFVGHFSSPQGDATAAFLETLLSREIHRALPWLKGVQVSRSKSAGPNDLVFLVTTHGTTITHPRSWIHEPRLFFGTVPLSVWHASLSEEVYFFMDILVGTLGAGVAMLLGTVITAFFIPNMLRKGTVDLLVSKPIRRPTLLLTKYIGGLLFLLLNAALVIVGVWAVLGWRSGIWANSFLLLVFVLTFQFAIYYAFSTLFAVLTRSAVVAMLMTGLLWLVLFLVGWSHRILTEMEKAPENERPSPGLVKTVGALHTVLPRVSDLSILNSRLIVGEIFPADSPEYRQAQKEYESVQWGENLAVSGAFIALMLGLACWWFSTRDY
jgi:ABC-type transport system involved in multi-copper enzyme maturation permease subunit